MTELTLILNTDCFCSFQTGAVASGYAPDAHIKEHPIRIASGEWTAVTGITEGTFTKPMPIGPEKFNPPTGKSFKLSMVTIGHRKDGVMVKEWLMWDNMSFLKQVGLAP